MISPGVCIHTLSDGQFFACMGVNVTGHIPGMTSINVSALQYNNKVPCIHINNMTGRVYHNKYYNIVITVSIDKYIYDRFCINTEKESAIYGIVNGTGETGASYGFNDTFMVYDLNNSNFYTVNVHNGYYYFFTTPSNKYEFYSYYNNTLHNVNVYCSNSSVPHNILQAPDKSVCTAIYKSNLLGN